MENLKKNFEEPVVQIINMCFCENIATSGGVCPKGYSVYADNQNCKRCKVIYYLGDTINHSDWTKANIDAGDSYIEANLSEALRAATKDFGVKDEISAQIKAYASTQLCPVGK